MRRIPKLDTSKKVFNIGIQLDANFVDCLNELLATSPKKLIELNGFADEQLNYTGFIDKFLKNDTVADASIDGNSNVHHHDIVTLEHEMIKPHEKILSYNKLFYEMKKEFGLDDAKRWLNDEWIGRMYLHDGYNASLKQYCFAVDIDSVARRGLYFLENYNAEPPKHLTTFNQMVVETVSYLSNRQSGAVGLPSYLIWAWWFWHKDCEDGFYLRNPDYYRDQCFQEIVYRLNQPFLRNSIESAFTNFSIFDRPYFEAFFGELIFPDGSYAIDFEEDIIQFEKDFMELESKIRQANMCTYPVLSFSMQRRNGKFTDEEFARWACKFNMLWNDSNFLITDEITSAASCCRLVSNIQEVDKDVNLGVCNSIGGTSLNVGSVKVNTINLARLAYESSNLEDYINRVKDETIVACKLLHVQRHTIQRNIEKGLLPNFSCGMLKMDRMFSTIGIIGLYEACEHFGLISKDEYGYVHYTKEARELGTKIFKAIHEKQDAFKASQGSSYQFNVEQIPAERAAVVLKEKDMMFYPNEKYTLPAYGNQFVPLGIKTTVKERVEVDGLYDQECNSGCILHFNLDAPLTDEETAWKLINYICDQGVTYFAFVTKISACKHNHGFYGDICPICGEPKETEYTKIVGFLTPVKTWSKERKEEFKMRDWMELNAMEDLQ